VSATHLSLRSTVTCREKQFHPTARVHSEDSIADSLSFQLRLPFVGGRLAVHRWNDLLIARSLDRSDLFPRMESREFIALDKMPVNLYLFLMKYR
jgi:hypothetical protein